MLATRTGGMRVSRMAAIALIACIATAVVLSVLDAGLRVLFDPARGSAYLATTTLVTDFRFLFEQGTLVAAILWVGARLLESRIVLSVGFDANDSDGLSVSGPDGDDVVWVGRRYRSRLEAEAVVAAMQERLRRSGPG